MSNQEPYLNAHLSSDTTAWVDMIWVPEDKRGQGIATEMYKEFEASLPTTVERVLVFAADTDGSGNSDDFWDSLGFHWRYTSHEEEDLSYEQRHEMIKGVNGHPTPDPIFIRSQEDEDDENVEEECGMCGQTPIYPEVLDKEGMCPDCIDVDEEDKN